MICEESIEDNNVNVNFNFNLEVMKKHEEEISKIPPKIIQMKCNSGYSYKDNQVKDSSSIIIDHYFVTRYSY